MVKGDKAYNQKHYEALGEVRKLVIGGRKEGEEKWWYCGTHSSGYHRLCVQLAGDRSEPEEDLHTSGLAPSLPVRVATLFVLSFLSLASA